MAENKTQPTTASVEDFLNQVESPKKREDAFHIKQIMEEITGEKSRDVGRIHRRFWPIPLQI